MIWLALVLLAICSPLHGASASPDASISPEICARQHGPAELCLIYSYSQVGWLMPTNAGPAAAAPTAAPTARYNEASRRTASGAASHASNVTADAMSVKSKEDSRAAVTGSTDAVVLTAAPTTSNDSLGATQTRFAGDDVSDASASMIANSTEVQAESTTTGNVQSAEVSYTATAAPEATEAIASGNGTVGGAERDEAGPAGAATGTTERATHESRIAPSQGSAETDTIDIPGNADKVSAAHSVDVALHNTTFVKSDTTDIAQSPSPNASNTISAQTNDTAPPAKTTKTPLTKHKYNYASPDCGARVQSSSPSSQHASGVLHKSRDRYMLTPCKADQHWVTIELCDEIRVEAVEISVWEYFSGVVREVRVSTGGDVGEDGEGEAGMEEVGTFVGRNVRGVQTFTLPKPTSFSRFIRVDFPSYYGSEYYCPVSQIKVYGMNQLEAYKWEQKQVALSSSRTSSEAAQETAPPHIAFHRLADANNTRADADMGELEKLVHAAARTARDPLPSAEDLLSSQNASALATATSSAAVDKEKPRRDRSDSESIYAFITRRLADLEGNSTLVLRYIDEQTRLLRRAQEDMYEWRREQEINDAQRWESERMRQEDRLGRIVSQLEAHRSDRQVMDAKFRVLEEQLSHERRRGFAQLGVLMMVIAIGAATRSETIEKLLKPILAEATRRKRRFTFSSSTDLGKKMRAESGDGLPSALKGAAREAGPAEENEEDVETPVEGVSRSNSMSYRRANGGTPTSMRRRGHRPEHYNHNHHAPRSSLPARYTPRKLAKTSHLHPMMGQSPNLADSTGSADGAPYAQSPITPLGPQV